MGGIKVQVGASGDDGYWCPNPDLFSNDSEYLLASRNSSGYYYHSFARWTGITIPAGAVITAAYVSIHQSPLSGSPLGKIWFNDVAAPSAPTSSSSAGGKALTTNGVVWTFSGTGWADSPDISTIINELIASHGPYSSGVMMMMLKYYTSAYPHQMMAKSWDYGDHSYGPTLTIQWAGSCGGAQIIGLELL